MAKKIFVFTLMIALGCSISLSALPTGISFAVGSAYSYIRELHLNGSSIQWGDEAHLAGVDVSATSLKEDERVGIHAAASFLFPFSTTQHGEQSFFVDHIPKSRSFAISLLAGPVLKVMEDEQLVLLLTIGFDFNQFFSYESTATTLSRTFGLGASLGADMKISENASFSAGVRGGYGIRGWQSETVGSQTTEGWNENINLLKVIPYASLSYSVGGLEKK
ncbi:MAG: hypothetical protein MI717_12945 [Spirochaetales bacterium]|nr:hypothetical protein [Spirochaetales bacterium]